MTQIPFITGIAKKVSINVAVPRYYTISCTIQYPNFCPFENIPSNFKTVFQGEVEDLSSRRVEMFHFPMLFECSSCHQYFCLDYCFIGVGRDTETSIAQYDYNFYHSEYNSDKVIEELSPNFKKIYLQAEIAEQKGLSEVDEFGYRKALEFLVKDYLIKSVTKDPDEVKEKTLSACIKMLEFKELMDTATLTAWIGNDGAHYVKQNPDLTIEDEKNYLASVVAFITFKLHAKKARKYKKSH